MANLFTQGRVPYQYGNPMGGASAVASAVAPAQQKQGILGRILGNPLVNFVLSYQLNKALQRRAQRAAEKGADYRLEKMLEARAKIRAALKPQFDADRRAALARVSGVYDDAWGIPRSSTEALVQSAMRSEHNDRATKAARKSLDFSRPTRVLYGEQESGY